MFADISFNGYRLLFIPDHGHRSCCNVASCDVVLCINYGNFLISEIHMCTICGCGGV